MGAEERRGGGCFPPSPPLLIRGEGGAGRCTKGREWNKKTGTRGEKNKTGRQQCLLKSISFVAPFGAKHVFCIDRVRSKPNI